MNINKNSYKAPLTSAVAEPQAVELDISQGLSEETLKSLRETDPFMYYSIPGVRQAAMRFKNIDYSDLNALLHYVNNGERQVPPHQRSESEPDLHRTHPEGQLPWNGSDPDLKKLGVAAPVPVQQTQTKIRRRSSISYEAHPDLILDDLMNDDTPIPQRPRQ